MPIPIDHSKPVRKSAKESAFIQLQQWIIDGTLQPGEKLNDKELAEALGVSRTPIRESLQLLEAQGFVKMYPGKSTRVTQVEEESMKDLLPPLAALQALAAELAVPHLTDAVISLLENTNEQFAQAVQAKNYFQALKIDEEFHQIIVDTANNPYLSNMIPFLQAHVRRLFFHISMILTEKSIKEHTAIIDYLKNRDTAGAADSMRKNWLRSIEDFRPLTSKQL
ncbi:GntR family transcriptional regulator [Pseudobacillus badius]|uniref:GntR family transcriptional regulator n=1 Tax=Bacillus badius TaxID=1455 RepID=UPI0007B0B9AB|nr:GntR family transcriptional regulator [Bacillus badius]KZO00280.1 GntR family transcriptional regulator [Bacillus badius]KZR59773.1 GntR family transcriptional regulator [Bacillus badius]MED0668322.1 GntR family transcriptional regulator [Bacillus badius]OCS86444.1 GntR family transcriptional regulator [Bacillus badius]OVE52092.1 GntR family transcriptional regulator [Bacillus badius]